MKTTKLSLHHIFVSFFVIFLILAFNGKKVQAAACAPISTGADATISSPCDDLYFNGAGNVVINSGVTVGNSVPGDFAVYANISPSTSVTNNGRIDADGSGIGVDDGLTFLTNSRTGSITARDLTGNESQFAIENYGTIGTLNNLVRLPLRLWVLAVTQMEF